MKRTLLLVILLVVVGAFAGFQQYSSWSLNRTQNNPGIKAQEGGAQSSPSQSRANQGRVLIRITPSQREAVLRSPSV